MYDAMKKPAVSILMMFISIVCFAQTTAKRLESAYQKFEADSQLVNALSSLYVIDASSGKIVFDKNSKIGMPTASTLKIITAATSYELLGQNFHYTTEFGYKGKIEKGNLMGMFYIVGSGDPTFGSWRYKSTVADLIKQNIITSIRKAGINNDSLHQGHLVLDKSKFDNHVYNDFWNWQDLGNYYGIGSCAINWRENQFDAIIKPGKKEGDHVEQIKLSPAYVQRRLWVFNDLFTGKAGSGDNAYFYPDLSESGYEYAMILRGTIPAGVDSFAVSASHPSPELYFTESFLADSQDDDIKVNSGMPLFRNITHRWAENFPIIDGYAGKSTVLYNHVSPSLDSIIYWFLKKSINLYGEALIKTIAQKKNGVGNTTDGIDILKKFWEEKGLASTELNIVDGSGLSALNRVTTHAQVTVLRYAKGRSWFTRFYDALPVYNGMKMKSGTINDVKGFCGYQKSNDGHEYIFSFLVNNYNGSSSAIVNKMYRVLDVLK